MRRWKRWITKTQEFLGLHRYDAVHHYHPSESLLEEVLFWNPRAAIWSSPRQNSSAEHERESYCEVGIAGMEKKKRRTLRRRRRHPSLQAKLERLNTFPALINKVRVGLGSACCSAGFRYSCVDRRGLQPPFNCPRAESVPKVEFVYEYRIGKQL